MKISEKLSQIKQKEGQLMRLYNLRDSIAKQPFKEAILTTEKDTTKLLEKKKKDFIKKKSVRFFAITKEIEQAKQELIEAKNKVNKLNVEKGVDAKLAEMKYLRLELSKLMELSTRVTGFLRDSIDLEVVDELKLAERIKELETRKSKLDAQIQTVNWSTEV